MSKVPAAILFVLLFSLAAAPAGAQAIETAYFAVDMPDSWELMQQRETGGITMAIFGTKARDARVTTVVSATFGIDVKTIASSFALQYKAKRQPAISKGGQASFAYNTYEGGDGMAWLAVQDDYYMFTTAEGDLRKARDFVRKLSSTKYPGLVPSL